MRRRALDCVTSSKSEKAPTTSIPAADLQRFAAEYLLECDYRQQSKATIDRRTTTTNLSWFLAHRDYPSCGPREIKELFRYLLHGHEEAEGRFVAIILASQQPSRGKDAQIAKPIAP